MYWIAESVFCLDFVYEFREGCMFEENWISSQWSVLTARRDPSSCEPHMKDDGFIQPMLTTRTVRFVTDSKCESADLD